MNTRIKLSKHTEETLEQFPHLLPTLHEAEAIILNHPSFIEVQEDMVWEVSDNYKTKKVAGVTTRPNGNTPDSSTFRLKISKKAPIRFFAKQRSTSISNVLNAGPDSLFTAKRNFRWDANGNIRRP